jgi:cobalt-zinc-cadmium efflux system protein
MHQIKASGHEHNHQSGKNIRIAFFLNFGFTLIEFAGGILTNSVAILSDALHDLGDSISLGLAWYLEKVSRKKSDENFTYGYKRFSLLGAIVNAIILSVGSIFILLETIPRLFNPQVANAKGMFLLAILGIMVNGAAVWRLKKGKSLNEKVVSLHLWEDVLGWAAILVGSVIMYFFDIPVIDPILSILISVYILWHVVKNIRLSLRIILQGSPHEVKPEFIRNITMQSPEVSSVHDIHTWTIDGNYHVVTLHVVLNQTLAMDEIGRLKSEIRKKLHEALDISHITIEFETSDEICSLEDCC